MANILLYIQEDQIDPVIEEGDVGSGQKTFGGMVNDGDRVFIASKYEGDLSIVGEIRFQLDGARVPRFGATAGRPWVDSLPQPPSFTGAAS